MQSIPNGKTGGLKNTMFTVLGDKKAETTFVALIFI
jgi:hypothetical protein